MKKIARKIAMLLIVVILSGSFTSCITGAALAYGTALEGADMGSMSGSGAAEVGLGIIALEILIFPVDLAVGGVIFLIKIIATVAREERGKKIDGIDTFSATISSLPEAELDSLTQKINSLPEEEIASFVEMVNALSDEEFSALAAAINNLSEEDIASSIETLNAMPQESIIASLNHFQHIEFGYQD